MVFSVCVCVEENEVLNLILCGFFGFFVKVVFLLMFIWEIQVFSLVSSSAFSLRGAGWLLAALAFIDAGIRAASPREKIEQKSPFSFPPASAAHCWQVKAACDATSTSIAYCEWFLLHPFTTSFFHMITSCCVLQVPCDWPLQAALSAPPPLPAAEVAADQALPSRTLFSLWGFFSCCAHSVLFLLPCSTCVTPSLKYIKWLS